MDSEFAVSVEAAVKHAPWRYYTGEADDRLRLQLFEQCQLEHRRQTPADVVDQFAAGYRKIVLHTPPPDEPPQCTPKPKRSPVK